MVRLWLFLSATVCVRRSLWRQGRILRLNASQPQNLHLDPAHSARFLSLGGKALLLFPAKQNPNQPECAPKIFFR